MSDAVAVTIVAVGLVVSLVVWSWAWYTLLQGALKGEFPP